MLEAWGSGRFVTYRDLPGWGGPPWSLLLTPGGASSSAGRSSRSSADQWATTTTTLLDDLAALDPGRWCVASFDRLVAKPQERPSGLRTRSSASGSTTPCPISSRRRATPSPRPSPRSGAATRRAGQRHGRGDAGGRAGPGRVRPGAGHQRPVAPVPGRRPAGRPGQRPAWRRSDATGDVDASPFRSVQHGAGFAAGPARSSGGSIAVSTYQSGRVILLRADGDRVNTHLRSLPQPDGHGPHPGPAVDRHRAGDLGVPRAAGAARRRPTPQAHRHAASSSRCQLVDGRRPHRTRSPTSRASCGPSTPGSRAWPRSTVSTASSPGGVPPSSPPSRPTTARPQRAAVSDGRPLYVTAHGAHRRGRRLAGGQGRRRVGGRRADRRGGGRRACRCPTRPGSSTAACGCATPARVGWRGPIPPPARSRSSASCRGSPGTGLRRPGAFVGLSQVPGARVRRPPPRRPPARAPVRLCGPSTRHRGHPRLHPLRRGRPGDLRRPAAAGRPTRSWSSPRPTWSAWPSSFPPRRWPSWS